MVGPVGLRVRGRGMEAEGKLAGGCVYWGLPVVVRRIGMWWLNECRPSEAAGWCSMSEARLEAREKVARKDLESAEIADLGKCCEGGVQGEGARGEGDF